MKLIKFNKGSKTTSIVLALGNFDGVHVGHQALIKEAVKYAKKNGLPCYAMTFDPHPQEIICPVRGLTLLTTMDEKLQLMKELGVDGVIVKEFSAKTASLMPEQFIREFLVDHLSVKKVFVGFDFAFGRQRSGKVADLVALGKKYDFSVTAVAPVRYQDHLVKSSTIRDMLTRGDFSKAIKLLGHPFTITGKVVKGMGRGRSLGFPTANLKVSRDKLIPAFGVYAARYGKYKCAVNIGSRPTFSEERFAVEAYVIGFSGDLLGKTIKVDLYKRLRDEIHFSDVEKLIAQIKKDVKSIKAAKLP